MKRLSLLRHAKSGWEDPALADFDRPLNARGREAARAMGREMRALGLAFGGVIASPAARVTGTIAELGESYGPLDPAYDERLYLAAPDTLLALVRATGDAHESLLLIGHNPGMERLALLLSRGGPLRDAVALKYPTGALAEIHFAVDQWRDVAESGGTLVRFLRPRDL
ncbi:MAG: phosphohistidine phosphatase [Sphingomonadales bacterium]|jgi:phosphohistidine phosphatase|nr:phosphohistidine phosphatase [Sphingomonadales bacterium]